MSEKSADASRVLVERSEDVALLTLNDPSRRNAFSDEMHSQLRAALADLTDPTDPCRVIVISGAAGTFCAGGALDTMTDMTSFEGRERMLRGRSLGRLMIESEKPIIAAVEKYAFGAGFSLALLCDHIVAARDASFCASFGRVGLIPDMGMFWSLPQRVGIGRVRRLTMLCETVGGEEAVDIGLADQLAEPSAALDLAMEKARAFTAAAPLPNRLTREAMASWPLPLDDALTFEAQGQAILFDSADAREGISAFLEKRRPTFSGR